MEQEFSLIKYLLRNSKVLEWMGILFKPLGVDPLSKVDARSKIASFERASMECQLQDDQNVLFQKAVDVSMDNSSSAVVRDTGAFDQDLHLALQLSMQDSSGVQANWSDGNKLLTDQSVMPSVVAQDDENALLKKAIDMSIDGSISNVVVLDTVIADAFDDRDSQPAFQLSVKDCTGDLSNPPDVSELLANQSPGPSILAQLPGADPNVVHAKDLLAPMQSLSENKKEDETVLKEDEKK